MKKAVTHSSRFHADDLFSTAVLELVFGDIEVTRTRDTKLISDADIVYDVGGVYDPDRLRFDHHQEGGAGIRENGIPYASFGLLWKQYGEKICGSKMVSNLVDEKLVQSIDASDNGVSVFKVTDIGVGPYLIQHALYSEMPTWKEGKTYDEAFFDSLQFAKHILNREIIRSKHYIEASDIINDIYSSSEDKRIIIFSKEHKFTSETIQEVLVQFDDPKFYIKYDPDDDTWRSHAIKIGPFTFENRVYFPVEWGGKKPKELQNISGIQDAVFCHNKLFLAVSKSKDGAIEMAKIALAK